MKKTVAAIILAAGRATRFQSSQNASQDAGQNALGASKLVAEFRGEPLIRHSLRAARNFTPRIVVTGCDRNHILEALKGLTFEEAYNADYALGLSTSLKKGVASLPPNVDGALLLLGDMPLISAELCKNLAAQFDRHPDADAIAPVCRGQQGHPVLLSRGIFSRIAALQGDAGARSLLRRADCKIIALPTEDEGALFDVDTRQDIISKNL